MFLCQVAVFPCLLDLSPVLKKEEIHHIQRIVHPLLLISPFG